MELFDSVDKIVKSLRSYNVKDAEFRRLNPETKLGYLGPGLRPRNAIWILVKDLHLKYDDAYQIVMELKQ